MKEMMDKEVMEDKVIKGMMMMTIYSIDFRWLEYENICNINY